MRNWTLRIGAGLILFVVLAAIVGLLFVDGTSPKPERDFLATNSAGRYGGVRLETAEEAAWHQAGGVAQGSGGDVGVVARGRGSQGSTESRPTGDAVPGVGPGGLVDAQTNHLAAYLSKGAGAPNFGPERVELWQLDTNWGGGSNWFVKVEPGIEANAGDRVVPVMMTNFGRFYGWGVESVTTNVLLVRHTRVVAVGHDDYKDWVRQTNESDEVVRMMDMRGSPMSGGIWADEAKTNLVITFAPGMGSGPVIPATDKSLKAAGPASAVVAAPDSQGEGKR